MIRIKISGLVKENENESKNGIISLLNNLKTDYKEGILPKKKMIISPSKKENFGINLSKNKCNSQTKSKEKNNRNGSKRSKSAVNKVKFKLNNKNKIKRNTSTKPNLFRDIVSLISNMKQEIKIN